MLTSIVIGFAKFVGFIVVVASAIITFYAAIHTINVNNHINVFFSGLVALLTGVIAGPLYILVSFYGLTHYFAISSLGAMLVVTPIFLAWCFMAFNTARNLLQG